MSKTNIRNETTLGLRRVWEEKLGNAWITCDSYGLVKFIGRNGIEYRSDADPFVSKLLDAIRNGNGEKRETIITEGINPPTNVKSGATPRGVPIYYEGIREPGR